MIQGPACCANGVRGYGSLNSGVVFVGIAPGSNEWNITKKPMTGPSGRLLDAILESINIPRSDVYCTNLICWYKDDPTPEEINVCHPRLLRELDELRPKVIVTLGALACKTLFSMSLAKARGAVMRGPFGALCMATYHPAAALHPDKARPEIQINCAYDLVRDLNKLPRILAGEYKWVEPKYTLIETPKNAQDLLDAIPKDWLVSLDIETNYDKETDRSHPFSDKITCIGLGWEDNHCYILTESALTEQLNWPPNIKLLGHNLMFDTIQIRVHQGVWLPIKHDTMLESYGCDERSIRGLHKLKPLQREHIGQDFYEEEEHKSDVKDLYLYNAKDVTGTRREHRFLNQWLHEEGTHECYEQILIPAANMLARSQYRGIYIDQHAADKLKATFIVELLTLQDELRSIGRAHGFENETFLNSPKQLKEFVSKLGLNLDSTAKAVLNNLLDDTDFETTSPTAFEFINKLLRYRTLYKLLRVYLLSVTDQIKYDGRVHPHPFLIGTVTGRLTYKDPGMQTLPKPKTVKDLAQIRRIFAATNDDYILIEADYAQIEAWVGAFLSKDPVLLADLQSGNWHTLTTEAVFNITKSSVDAQTWSFYYDAGKHLNYGCMYEEGPEGLTRRPPIGMGCSFAIAKVYHQKWYSRYKVFNQWRADIKRTAREQGFIVTPFGRKRRFPLIVNSHQERQMVNSPIQSTASDYTLTSAIRLWPKLEVLDTHLLFIEHDALYYEAPKSNLQEVANLIKTIMETPPLEGLPSIKIEIVSGSNLHDMIDWCMTCMVPLVDRVCPICGKKK